MTGKYIKKGVPLVGHATIGYGHKLTKEEFNSATFLGYNIYSGNLPEHIAEPYISKESAFVLSKNVIDRGNFSCNQQEALLSLGYNAGSKVLKYILSGKTKKEVIRRWGRIITSKGKVLKGLILRRNEEISLYLKRI